MTEVTNAYMQLRVQLQQEFHVLHDEMEKLGVPPINSEENAGAAELKAETTPA